MKIEKQPTKIVAQKKEQPKPEPKPEPVEPKPVEPIEKPVAAPKAEEPTPKVTSEPDISKVSDSDDIKSKREQMFEEARIKQMQIRRNAVIAKKNRRIFQIVTLLTILFLLLFAPIYPNQETTHNDFSYLRSEDVNIEHPLGDYFSPYQFMRFKNEVAHSSEYIKHSKVHYNLRDMQVNVTLTEYKPLAKDVENNVYFYEDEEVVVKSDIDLYAPIITGFEQDTMESLLAALSSLDYDVITQIDTIEYVGTEDDPELLKMGMDGDHTVYIDIGQIKKKLPYYNQIKQIIDEKADGKPGIIHLDIGDYYEPK